MKNNFIVKVLPLVLILSICFPVMSFAIAENTSNSQALLNSLYNTTTNTTTSSTNTTSSSTSNSNNSNTLNEQTNSGGSFTITEIPETTLGDNNVTKLKFIMLEAKPKSSIIVSIGANNINSITKLELIFKRVSRENENKAYSATVTNLKSLEPSFILPEELEGGDKIELIYITVEDDKGTHYISNISDIVTDRKYTIEVLADGTNYNLNKISLNGETAIKSDGTLNFDIDLSSGIENLGLLFRNIESNNGFYFAISNKDGLHNKPKVDLSKITTKGNRLAPGKYVLSDAYINPGPKTIQYTTFKQYGDQRELKDIVEFEISEEEEDTNKLTISAFSIGDNKTQELNTKKGKIIPLWIEANEKVKGGALTLLDRQHGQLINVAIQENLDSTQDYSTYIIMPETAYLAEYELTYATLKTETTTNYFRKGNGTNRVKGFDLNIKINVTEKSPSDDNRIMSLDNSDMLAKDIEDVKNLPSNTKIKLFTGFNPIVSIEVFKAIKNTKVELIIYDYNNNQWIFNGEEIETAKTIDSSIETKTIDSDKEKYEIKSGIEIAFKNNEELPGKAQIRIKNTKLSEQELPEKNGYTYYYDEKAKLFDRVTMQISVTDDNYYEFYINHNSDYLIVSDQINNQFVSNKTDDYILNGGKAENINNNGNENELITEVEQPTQTETKKDNSMLIIVIVCITLVILFGVILLIIKKSKKKDLSSGNKLFHNSSNEKNVNNLNNINNLNNTNIINNTDNTNEMNNTDAFNNQNNNVNNVNDVNNINNINNVNDYSEYYNNNNYDYNNNNNNNDIMFNNFNNQNNNINDYSEYYNNNNDMYNNNNNNININNNYTNQNNDMNNNFNNQDDNINNVENNQNNDINQQ